jgi:dihydrofolate reductase
MTSIVYIATSIDGFIARKDGSIDWLIELPNPEGTDYGYAEFIQRIDGILMGRHTFETVLSFPLWPYSQPVFVLSTSLTGIPKDLSGKAEIVKGGVKEILTELEAKGITTLYVDGGKTIQSFLKEDLIDEMIIARIPVVLGDGIPLFSAQKRELHFEHVKTVVYNNAVAKSSYIRAR